MKYLSTIAVVLFAFALCAAQTPAKTTIVPKTAPAVEEVKKPKEEKAYTPTPDQEKDLKIAQLAAQLAQVQYGVRAQALPEFADFQKKMIDLSRECAQVKEANKWPKEVQCDMQTVPIKFSVPAPAKP